MAVAAKDIPAPDLVPVRRALLSVSDKTGLSDFAAALAKAGIELVSTGGTAKAIADADIPVRDVSELTGFPEIMDGRVKTLHPAIHGALLGVRDDPDHADAMHQHGIAADRPRRRQPLPVRGGQRFRRRLGCDRREHRHRRSGDAARGCQEPRLCGGGHRPGGLCVAAQRAGNELRQPVACLSQEARGQGLCPHGGLRRGDLRLVRRGAGDRAPGLAGIRRAAAKA